MRMREWRRGIVIGLCVLAGAGLIPAGKAEAGAVKSEERTVSHGLTSGTLVLHGNLTSVATFSMTGAFSVGSATSLKWDLPRMTSFQENGYTERFDALTYSFNVQPDTFSDLEVGGKPVRRFVWQMPPADTVIHVTESFRATVHSELSAFHSTAVYPMQGVTPDAATYLQSTAMVRLPAGFEPLLHRLTAGRRTERAVVSAVVNWVAAHTAYDSGMIGNAVTASAVLRHHRAICRGYDNVTSGILRALGIPVRTEFGWASAGTVKFPGPNHGSAFIRWSVPNSSGEAHAWLSVYFPDAGWVPLDPQREKFFVDSHHFAFFSSMDAGMPTTGSWSADYAGDASVTGAPLSNGSTEIVPGTDNGSTVTLHEKDSVHAVLSGFRHDVHGVLLFTR